MEITTEPVYIRDSDINIHGNIILQLSMAVNKLWPGEALGAQKFHQVWRVYVRSPRTRAGLIVRGLDLSGSNITVHDDNPVLDNNKHTERVVIKDLPATLSSERIHNFLLGFSQLRIKSRILYAKERIGGEEMSPFINGDHFPKRVSSVDNLVGYGTNHSKTFANDATLMAIVRLMWICVSRLILMKL